MIRSFIAVQHVDPGFEPKGVLTFLLPARASGLRTGAVRPQLASGCTRCQASPA